MRLRFYKHLKLFLSTTMLPFLCLALLAGCSATPRGETDGMLTDEDAKSGEPAAIEQTVSPERIVHLKSESLDSLIDPQQVAILFVNVGKADAAILRFGETTVLIDTGSAESAPQLIAGLNALGVKNISAVFITHSHSDHLGGLTALSANYDVPMVYSPFYAEQDKDGMGKIVKRAEKLRLPHKELLAGDVVPITTDVSFTVLGPLSLNEEDDNDNSLVLQFSYAGNTFLFAGDMQFVEEQAVIQSGTSLKSDVLKVGNHGNPDATGDDFASLVDPAFALISTDTSVDADSASPRIYAALPNAEVAVTQDFPIGVLLTLDDSGAISLHNPARGSASSTVLIDSFSVERQNVTLRNTGSESQDLSGMILYSVRSDAVLRFPEGAMLPAGETLIIGAGGDFSFPSEDKPLSKKKDNTVILFDRFGALVNQLEQ